MSSRCSCKATHSIKLASFSVIFIADIMAAARAASGAFGLQTRLCVRIEGPLTQSGYCNAVPSFEAPRSSNDRILQGHIFTQILSRQS